MQKQAILYGVIGILIGSFLTYMITNNQTLSKPDAMEKTAGHMGMGSSMTDMMDLLEGTTGNAFDAAFIETMIIHHEGAIEMAKEAKVSAKHDEIKTLADDIITAQTKEIEMMKSWKTQWGY